MGSAQRLKNDWAYLSRYALWIKDRDDSVHRRLWDTMRPFVRSWGRARLANSLKTTLPTPLMGLEIHDVSG